VQLPQKRQPRRRLTVEQHEDDGEVMLLDAAVECFVVLHRLPWADAVFAHQQDEGRRLGDLPSKLREPQAPGAQALRRKKYLCFRILTPQRRFEALHEPQILRIVAQEPASHSKHRVGAVTRRETLGPVARFECSGPSGIEPLQG